MVDVKFDSVTKVLGQVRAVNCLTLEIQPREFFFLLGPSGCGKTTALRLAREKWQDPAFRNQKLNEWALFARKKYRAHLRPPLIRSEWLTLFSSVILVTGLLYYLWRRPG